MRTASGALEAILASGQFYRADLYTFTLTDGTVLKYTSFDQTVGSFDSSLGWERSQWKLSTGLNVDTMDVTLHATPADLIGTVPVIEHIASGAWDGAAVTVERAIMPTPGDISAGTVLIFAGWLGEISEIGRIHCHMQLQSKLALLNIGLPKGLFQPSCRHVLFDAGCTLNRADFQTDGSVQAGSTPQIIQTGVASSGAIAGPTAAPSLSSHTAADVNLPLNATYYVKTTYITAYGETVPSPESSLLVAPSNGILQVASPPGATGATGWNVYIGASPGDEQLQNTVGLALGSSFDIPQAGIYLSGIAPPTMVTQGFYALGTIKMLTGANAGASRTIDASDAAGAVTLRVPFFNPVVAGDTFTLTQGCDHTMATCASAKFDNISHGGFFPYIPVPEVGG
jgi:hypothetical protein